MSTAARTSASACSDRDSRCSACRRDRNSACRFARRRTFSRRFARPRTIALRSPQNLSRQLARRRDFPVRFARRRAHTRSTSSPPAAVPVAPDGAALRRPRRPERVHRNHLAEVERGKPKRTCIRDRSTDRDRCAAPDRDESSRTEYPPDAPASAPARKPRTAPRSRDEHDRGEYDRSRPHTHRSRALRRDPARDSCILVHGGRAAKVTGELRRQERHRDHGNAGDEAEHVMPNVCFCPARYVISRPRLRTVRRRKGRGGRVVDAQRVASAPTAGQPDAVEHEQCGGQRRPR